MPSDFPPTGFVHSCRLEKPPVNEPVSLTLADGITVRGMWNGAQWIHHASGCAVDAVEWELYDRPT